MSGGGTPPFGPNAGTAATTAARGPRRGCRHSRRGTSAPWPGGSSADGELDSAWRHSCRDVFAPRVPVTNDRKYPSPFTEGPGCNTLHPSAEIDLVPLRPLVDLLAILAEELGDLGDIAAAALERAAEILPRGHA